MVSNYATFTRNEDDPPKRIFFDWCCNCCLKKINLLKRTDEDESDESIVKITRYSATSVTSSETENAGEWLCLIKIRTCPNRKLI